MATINNKYIGVRRFTALGDLSPLGFWSVICYRCDGSIGTMTPDTLQRAIMATADKGGVLCPTCRAKSCKQCWQESENCDICLFCTWQNNIAKREGLTMDGKTA